MHKRGFPLYCDSIGRWEKIGSVRLFRGFGGNIGLVPIFCGGGARLAARGRDVEGEWKDVGVLEGNVKEERKSILKEEEEEEVWEGRLG